MKEEIAVIVTTSATEFGDLVSPNEFQTNFKGRSTHLLPLKLPLRWMVQRTLGQSLKNLAFHFYADGALNSLQRHQRLGVF